MKQLTIQALNQVTPIDCLGPKCSPTVRLPTPQVIQNIPLVNIQNVPSMGMSTNMSTPEYVPSVVPNVNSFHFKEKNSAIFDGSETKQEEKSAKPSSNLRKNI